MVFHSFSRILAYIRHFLDRSLGLKQRGLPSSSVVHDIVSDNLAVDGIVASRNLKTLTHAATRTVIGIAGLKNTPRG